MDRAYSGKKMRTTATELGYAPVVPPKRNYKEQWEYEVERFFRRIFTRYDKLDIIFAGFILLAMIIDSLV